MASFTTSNFSNIHHPSYFCMFILTATALLWYGYRDKWQGFTLKWILPVFAYFLVIYGLCLSLAGMLVLFALGCIVVLRFILRKYGKKGFAAALVVFPALAVVLFLTVPQMKRQFGDASGFFMEYVKNPREFIRVRPDYKEGNEVRLIMWTIAAEDFARHPFGVGTGNVDDHLSYNLAQYGQKEMAKKDADGLILYNPHNQYLQTAMEIGVIGLALLLLLIVSAVRFAVRMKNPVLLVLVTVFAFNSLFESMLQRQSGIVFLSFWICLLIVWSRSLHTERQPQ
jgi:O-antigen ligase